MGERRSGVGERGAGIWRSGGRLVRRRRCRRGVDRCILVRGWGWGCIFWYRQVRRWWWWCMGRRRGQGIWSWVVS
jgi:hypothetical protein